MFCTAETHKETSKTILPLVSRGAVAWKADDQLNDITVYKNTEKGTNYPCGVNLLRWLMAGFSLWTHPADGVIITN